MTPPLLPRGNTVNDIVESWLDTYRAAGRAEGTVRVRGSYLRTFGKAVPLLEATTDDLLSYLASRSDVAPETRKAMLVSLRGFYRWAYRRGHLAEDLSLELPSAHVPIGQPKPIPIEALTRARAIADDETSLMLDLGALAGLRRAEIAQVHSDHLTDLGLLVQGKGGKVRLVPIHPRLRERLARLQGFAFPSPKRPGMPVSPDYVSSRLERVLPAPHTAHSLRHYFASAAFKGTHDIRAVQQLLGHASVETTQRYVATDNDALAAAVFAVA